MPQSSEESKNEILKQQTEAKEAKRRQENARKAKAFADQEFPNEKWEQVEDGIYKSKNRSTGDAVYQQELRDAQILRDFGSTVYLVPYNSRMKGTQYDAIVNGIKFEFKNVGGNANTLEHQFLRSRSQSPNVFINLETSHLTRRHIMATLYGARNKIGTDTSHGYSYYNRFKGGSIILKIKDEENLIYLNADELKPPG